MSDKWLRYNNLWLLMILVLSTLLFWSWCKHKSFVKYRQVLTKQDIPAIIIRKGLQIPIKLQLEGDKKHDSLTCLLKESIF